MNDKNSDKISSDIEDTLNEFYLEAKENIKKLGLDVDLILSKKDEIKQYLIKNIGEPHLGYDEQKIVEFVPTAIKAVKLYEGIEELYRKSEVVRNMNKEEWEKYRKGFKWSQTGRADDIKTEGDGIAKQLFEALYLEYSGIKVKDKLLIDAMKNAPIVKDVLDDYTVSRSYANNYNFLDQFTLVKKTES